LNLTLTLALIGGQKEAKQKSHGKRQEAINEGARGRVRVRVRLSVRVRVRVRVRVKLKVRLRLRVRLRLSVRVMNGIREAARESNPLPYRDP